MHRHSRAAAQNEAGFSLASRGSRAGLRSETPGSQCDWECDQSTFHFVDARVVKSYTASDTMNKQAGVAQLVEHLICNQRVGGSIPSASSIFPLFRAVACRTSFKAKMLGDCGPYS
jgi:hypothetical protein